MNNLPFKFCGASLHALPSGGIWWPIEGLYCASDLHFGKSERLARMGGALLPPYESLETILRLEEDLTQLPVRVVVALGDSFDDVAAASGLSADVVGRIQKLQAGRRWIWIAGNHDPAPLALGGDHRDEFAIGGLTFRHEAIPGAIGEVSGHYHPKVRVRHRGGSTSRPCFLFDKRRLILPAFGTYTGGLRTTDKVLCDLMKDDAEVILTGNRMGRIPMPRS